jgi:hypothetical protein
MFSIADVLDDELGTEQEEGEEEEESSLVHPIRTSLSITKVCLPYLYFRSFVNYAISQLVLEH